jgi:hypothetical protein
MDISWCFHQEGFQNGDADNVGKLQPSFNGEGTNKLLYFRLPSTRPS